MASPMARVRPAVGRTFRSLHHRNARLYLAGLAVSNVGTWMQVVAQGWLVLTLTDDSGVALGIVTALQFTPLLLGGAWGGVVADRSDKRRLLLATQVVACALAVVLWAATATGTVTLGLVYVLAFLLGCVNAVDNPTRRSFISELVEPDEVANAISLNTAVMTSSRMVGPAVAGVLIGTVGIAACFLLNAISFVAVLLGLLAIDVGALRKAERVARAKGQVREGLRYAWATPEIRTTLLMVAVISTLAFEYQVVLPLMAAEAFEGGAGAYGLLFSVLSLGSLSGSLISAARKGPTRAYLVGSAATFGATMLVASAAPTLAVALVAVVPMGAAGAAFVTTASALLQTTTRPDVRGRVLALFSVVFLGSTPVGGLIVGTVAEHLGARSGFVVGGTTSLVVAAVVTLRRRRRPDAPGDGETERAVEGRVPVAAA